MSLAFLPRGSSSRRTTVVVAIVAVGLAATCWASWALRSAEKRRITDGLLQRAESEQALIHHLVVDHFDGLKRLAAVFSLQRFTPPETFQPIAASVLEQHPSLIRIDWVPYVKGGERSFFEQRSGATPESRLRIASPETGSDAEIFPFYYTQGLPRPEAERGTDVREKGFGPDLQRARSHRRLVITAKREITVAGAPQSVFTIICPVFSSITQPSQGVREGDFLGYLLGTLRAGGLLAGVRDQSSASDTDVLLLDATPGTPPAMQALAYLSGDLAAPVPTVEEFRQGWHREDPLLIGERLWLVLHRANPAWARTQSTFLPQIVWLVGLALTGMTAAYVRISLRRTELVEREVEARTQELQSARLALQGDAERIGAAEAQLRSSQQQLHALMENSPSAIFVKDAQGRYQTVNRRFAEMYNRAREEFIGRSDLDLFPPEVAARLRLSDTRVLSSGKAIELEESFAFPGGSHTSIIQKFALVDEQGRVQGLCGIATDISERKRAEAEIRESRRQLESLLGQLPGMAFRFINDGQMTPVYVSRGSLGLTGHSARDFIEGVVRYTDVIHPEDRERSRSAIAAAVKKRRSFEVEYRIVDRAGRIKWVLERGQGVFDEDGKLLFIEGLAIDITQRKDAEAEKLIVERRLLEGQKLESIGVLAGGIAHDFNNLLTGIIGNANLAALDLPPSSRLHQNLKQIELASQRAAELCQQMLAYAGKGRFVVQRVELGQLVETTVPLLRASISKKASLQFELAPSTPPVLADPTQMRQIVMNLVINASEALGDQDGRIVISTKAIRPTADSFAGAVLSPTEIGNEYVMLEVRDTGCGMTPETIAKIFDPFFTTKFAGRGLGLAAVLGIIRSHKGGLKVTSTPGVGSTFTLLFPPVAGPLETSLPRRGTSTPWRQEGLALIVDDEDHVRNVTAGMLRSCGMQTELARDGYEALDLFRARAEEFDVVILDMTMPRLSGEETLLLLREIRPDVRVLFMSGYNRKEVVDSMAGKGLLSFIQKPFTLESLREHLQQVLA